MRIFIKVVTYNDEILVELLGAASMSYLIKWMLKEGESLLILALQVAK